MSAAIVVPGARTGPRDPEPHDERTMQHRKYENRDLRSPEYKYYLESIYFLDLNG